MRILFALAVATLTAGCASSLSSHFTPVQVASYSDVEVKQKGKDVLQLLNDVRSWKVGFSGIKYGDGVADLTRGVDLDLHVYDEYGSKDEAFWFRIEDSKTEVNQWWMYLVFDYKLNGTWQKASGVVLGPDGACLPHIWLGGQRNVCGALSKDEWEQISSKALSLSRHIQLVN